MVKNLPAMQETQVQSLDPDDPLEKGMATTPVFLPGEFHGLRNLAGYSPWSLKESDMTEWLTYMYGGILCSHENEMLPFVATWMGLKNIMLNECQTENDKYCTISWYHLYVESKKYNKLVNKTKTKQTHRYREKISGYQLQGSGEQRGDRMGGSNYWI